MDIKYAEGYCPREDLAYLAGIIDGDGSICIIYNKKKDNYYAKVAVGMTDKAPIDLLCAIFPSHMWADKLKSGKTIWKWHTVYSNVVPFLRAIYEFLRVKKEQADIIFEFFSVECKHRRQGLPEEEKKRRKQLCEKLRQLHRGGDFD